MQVELRMKDRGWKGRNQSMRGVPPTMCRWSWSKMNAGVVPQQFNIGKR
jgi:hypothetical protein